MIRMGVKYYLILDSVQVNTYDNISELNTKRIEVEKEFGETLWSERSPDPAPSNNNKRNF